MELTIGDARTMLVDIRRSSASWARTVDPILTGAVMAWNIRHRECGPGCAVTGDDCPADPVVI